MIVDLGQLKETAFASTSQSWEVDRGIAILLGNYYDQGICPYEPGITYWHRITDDGDIDRVYPVRPVTGNTDLAISVTRKLCPNVQWGLFTDPHRGYGVWINDVTLPVYAPTVPLAIIRAVISYKMK